MTYEEVRITKHRDVHIGFHKNTYDRSLILMVLQITCDRRTKTLSMF